MEESIHGDKPESYYSNPSRRDPLRTRCMCGDDSETSLLPQGHSASRRGRSKSMEATCKSHESEFRYRRRGPQLTFREGVGVRRKLLTALLLCMFRITTPQVLIILLESDRLVAYPGQRAKFACYICTGQVPDALIGLWHVSRRIQIGARIKRRTAQMSSFAQNPG
jgi:hypothetical protein